MNRYHKSQKEKCDCCKNYKWVDFLCTDLIWKEVIGPTDSGVFCLNCFIQKAQDKDIILSREDFMEIFIYNLSSDCVLQSISIFESF